MNIYILTDWKYKLSADHQNDPKQTQVLLRLRPAAPAADPAASRGPVISGTCEEEPDALQSFTICPILL